MEGSQPGSHKSYKATTTHREEQSQGLRLADSAGALADLLSGHLPSELLSRGGQVHSGNILHMIFFKDPQDIMDTQAGSGLGQGCGLVQATEVKR